MLRPVPPGGSANLAEYISQNNTNISSLQNTSTNLQTQIDTNRSSIQGLASGSPKGVYQTVVALVNANPDTGVYIVTADGHIYSWTKDASNAIDLGIYQAAGFDDNKLLKYIKYEEPFNLIKFDAMEDGFIVDNTGSISHTSTALYYTTDYIPVQYGHKYRCVNRCRKCLYYDTSKVAISNTFIDSQNLYDYDFVATSDGYMRATFYKVNDINNAVIDITNIEDISILSTNKWWRPLKNTSLSEKQIDEINRDIIGYDSIKLSPTSINNHQYLQANSDNGWQNNSNVNTKRFSCIKGHRYKVTCSLHGDGAGYTLIYNLGQGTRFYYRSPASLTDDYQLKDYIITIPEDFPAENGEILVTEWIALENQTGVSEYINKDVASKAYVQSAIENFIDTSVFEEYINQIHASNILWGKKYVACGDSFTHGDFTGYVDSEGHTGTASDAYDTEWGVYKTYPYWIAKRNNMTLINEAVNGSTMTNNDNSPTGRFSYTRYKAIPEDADYITFKFGINDSASHQNMPIGTIDDTETNTFYGAWNVVLTWIIENRPKAKLGILIGNGLQGSGHGVQDEVYCVAMRAIAKKFGIPYLDEDLDDQVPLTFRTNKQVDSTIATLRNNQYKVSSTNGHPNLECHKVQSTFVEHFLRSL